MIPVMTTADPEDIDQLLRRAANGDAAGWCALVERYHDRLRRSVGLRLDPRLRGRVDASDILQDTYLDASRQLADYARDPPLPFFLWLRRIAGSRLYKVHRQYLGTRMREVGREVSIDRGPLPGASSAALAARLLGHDDRPSEAMQRAERRARIQDALDQMDPTDREVLVLRHFEQLTSPEAARELGISEAAAAKRYIRALARLRGLLARAGGGSEP